MRRLMYAIALTQVAVGAANGQAHKPRAAGIAPPPPVAQSPYGGTNPAPVVYGSVPVFVTTDGRVFANFGYGYEEVVRACGHYQAPSGPSSYRPGQSSDQQSPSSTPSTYEPSTFGPGNTQPAPAQPTESERMLPAGHAPPNPGAGQQRARSSACYSSDQRGRIIVIR